MTGDGPIGGTAALFGHRWLQCHRFVTKMGRRWQHNRRRTSIPIRPAPSDLERESCRQPVQRGIEWLEDALPVEITISTVEKLVLLA